MKRGAVPHETMGRIERAILKVAPTWAAQRAHARLRAMASQQAYEATENSRLRRRARDFGNGNAVTSAAHKPLRDMARQMDRNHDLARGILNVLVRNVVGPNGIGVEPQPLNADGSVNEALAEQLASLHTAWAKLPEVTGELNWARSEQLLCRSWFRDGESLWQYLEGDVQYLTHPTSVPFSLELMEADLLPIDYNDAGRGIVQGIERSAWNKPVAYWLYKQHPGDPYASMVPQIKRVSTDVIGHLKLIDRIGQLRGVSMFASVLSRLEDLKDYEESERIAAKVAASMAAYIKKGTPEDYTAPIPDENGCLPAQREMSFSAGMIFDDLMVGEDVGTIDSKRPNPNAVPWRDGQLRAVAAGADVSNSSASRNYNGTYSAQRQELVEQDSAYKLLSNAFIDQCSREVYERWVAAAVFSGRVKAPRGATFAQLCNAMYIAPQMPWIDPLKEANAYGLLEDRAYISGPEVVRRRGGNPRDTLRAEEGWQKRLNESGIANTTTQPKNAAATTANANAAAASAYQDTSNG